MIDLPCRIGHTLAMAAAILVSLGLWAEASAQASGDFVEDVSFTRGKWGEPLDYQDGDDSEAVWLVAVVDGAPRQSLLCVDWVDDDGRVLDKECQSLPEGAAILTFESPRTGGYGADRVSARLEAGKAGVEPKLLGEYTLDWPPPVAAAAPEPVPPPAAYRYRNPPEFPWPPPEPTSSVSLKRDLLANGNGKLGDVADHMVSALAEVGYSEKSFYAVPGGFALVTRLEQIEPDGTPLPEPGRWSQAPPPSKIFSLGAFFGSLFNAPVGNYRVIAFIVTDQPFVTDGEVSAEEMEGFLAGGLSWLPEVIRARDFTAGHVGTALIYQFRKAGLYGDPVLNPDGAPTAQAQLDRTGIFSSLRQ